MPCSAPSSSSPALVTSTAVVVVAGALPLVATTTRTLLPESLGRTFGKVAVDVDVDLQGILRKPGKETT